VLVDTPYAIFIQWLNEEYFPDSADKRVFIFYDNVKKKSYQTRNFDAFLDMLAKLPRGITLYKYDTCTILRDEMPKEQRDKLEKISPNGIPVWDGNDNRIRGVCFCQYEWDFILPGDVEEEK